MKKPQSPCLRCTQRTTECHMKCPNDLYDKYVQDLKEYNKILIGEKLKDTPKRALWTKTRRESIAGRYGKGRK